MKWKTFPISTITNNLDGRRKPLNDEERQQITKIGLYPYIGANNIMGYVDEYLFDEEILCLAEDGGSWGKGQQCSVIFNGKCWVNNHAHVITAKNGVDLRYIKYYLNWNDLTKYITGTTRGKLTKGALNSIPVPLPPLHIQQQIADTLDKADALRQKDQQLLQKYDELAQSIFYDMFGNLSNTNLDTILLNNIASVTSGITKNLRQLKNDDVEVPYLRVANVQDGFLDLREMKTIRAPLNEVIKYNLQKGDVVITEGGDPDKLGRGSIWNEEVEGCSFQNHIFRIRVYKPVITPFFLSKVLGSKYGKSYFLKASKQTTGIASINSTQLKAFPVKIPSLKLQNEYELAVTRITNLKKIGSKSLRKSSRLFESLQSSFYL